MDQKLTEEQQRAAHKIIKANRGDCAKESNFLSCIDCPNSSCNSGVLCFVSNFPESSKSPTFQAENLRTSQAWLDEHITDAEIMAETPKEFCERMVRTEGNGKCIPGCEKLCLKCVLNLCETGCSGSIFRFRRANIYLASHPATSQEPPKRRPTPEEMVVGAPVRVRLWDELVRDGKLSDRGHIQFPTIYFNNEMRQYCGNAYKVIKGGGYPHLDGCGDWTFIPEMLDYVEPEKVVDPKPVANTPTPEALRIIALEGQVDDLTKKLAASKKLCERQQRRLRANWEAKRDEEMATREEIIAWFDAGKGAAMISYEGSKICPKGHSSWIPATRGNLKL